MTPEAGRVVVARIQGQPRHRVAGVPGPAGQQRRLAVTGGRADKHQATAQGLVEPFGQPGRGRKSGREPGGCSLVSSRVLRPVISGMVAVGRSAIAHDPRGCTHAARRWKTIVVAAGRRRPVPAPQTSYPGPISPEGTAVDRVRLDAALPDRLSPATTRRPGRLAAAGSGPCRLSPWS